MEPHVKGHYEPVPFAAGATNRQGGRVGSHRSRRWIRRRRNLRAIALSCLACLAFIAFAQWKQMLRSPRKPLPLLSSSQLQEDLRTCSELRKKPQDPIGLGRDRNARYVQGHKPTLIRNATIWVGEPAAGTSPQEARAGKGYSWVRGDVFSQYGLIQRVESHISPDSLPEDTLVWDARGRQLTSGIVDMHSHAGVSPLPNLAGTEDTNELSSDMTPYVRSIDGFDPLDPQIQVIKSGGVTTSLVLPGSGNNIGGEAFVFKHAVGERDGRPEISAWDMLADPDRNWRYIKMACGENPKRVYGRIGHGPFSRLGESWEFRHAFEQAADLVRRQDDWCHGAETLGLGSMNEYLPRDLAWETLGAVLRGQVHVNTHCYTVPDLEAFIDHTNEFKFPLRAFHHAHQTFLVPEILKRAWGDRPPASALFADNMFYKAEAHVASEYAGKILWDHGLTPVYVSDNPVLNAQHVVFEAAKAYRYGLPYHAALASVTTAPAELLGLGQRLGKVKPGYDADLVVWDSDPLSVGATPLQVWIDGFAQFEDPVELDKPVTKPITPDERLGEAAQESRQVLHDVIFTGVTKVLLSDSEDGEKVPDPMPEGPTNVIVTGGKITCIGHCTSEMEAASSHHVMALDNGYLVKSFTAFGSTIGLNAIDYESDTDNGLNPDKFSRAIDGLALDNQKLHAAHKYGITKAVSAPRLVGALSQHGTSVGFMTDAKHALEKDAVWSQDVAVHYTVTLGAKLDAQPSISAVFAALRKSLLEAVSSREEDAAAYPYSEQAHLRKVVRGQLPLVLTAHSADAIAAALRLKDDVERAVEASDSSSSSSSPSSSSPSSRMRMVILGGAEAHLVASELAAADVGVVLAPFQAFGASWDQRRSLSGAPLTNGTAVDALLDAGVVTAIGLEEDWLVRDLGLLAGIALKNGRQRLDERTALDLVSTNIYTMLGIEEPKTGNFAVFEGSPLEIDGRVRAVSGRAHLSVYMR
ncbi:hypothetical protein ACRALDRAFT_1047363 [Sodiomyces alcalophilus JCM 7366]|uniref:uncharacterized protein n=1 Tax=Sodiomyces alcalophilus JCM 7366 TaxID=591952 RepID=UPI0039B4B87E